MRDLKRSLKKSNNSSPGPDQIHYEILRHLPIETLHILLDIINETWKSEKNGLLAKQQWRYRSNRSTVDNLVRLETFIRDAFIHNQHLVAVFFDFQKAYDTTWKYGILKA